MAVNYDKSSIDSIFNFSKRLTGKTLSEVVSLPPEIMNSKNRGDLGSLVEKYFFEHQPPNNHDPDFVEAGLELKTTGVIKNSTGKYSAKERLVLTMINYKKLDEENWEQSTFLKKCGLMLILFYLYSKETPVIDRKFVLNPLLYRIPESDLIIIKKDWEFIRNKVHEGKAHELSEGDTFYLGACRKGAGGEKESPQSQPNSDIKAKSRAFSFKQSYLNKLIEGIDKNERLLGVNEKNDFDEALQNKFKEFLGKPTDEICSLFKFLDANPRPKAFRRSLALKILSKDGNGIVELKKAGIEMKTIVLKANGKPKEHMSFPGFKFLEIINQSWEESSFFEKLESKFLFVVFQIGLDGVERLQKVGFWNMPYADRVEAKKVWELTKKRVAIDATDLPRITENRIAHVRPKGSDGEDKIETPQGTLHLKQCFWLNSGYVAEIVSNL